MGRATDPLSVLQIFDLIREIASRHSGLPVAIDILGMVIHCANEKDEKYALELRVNCLAFLKSFELASVERHGNMTQHHIDQILAFVLSFSPISERDCSSVVDLLDALFSRRIQTNLREYEFVKPFLSFWTKLTLDAIYRRDEDGSYRKATSLLSDFDSDWRENPLSGAHEQVILDWCRSSPSDRCAFIAGVCGPFGKSGEEGAGSNAAVSPLAASVFRLSPNKEQIIGIFVQRAEPMSWSGSRAEIIRSRAAAIQNLVDAEDIQWAFLEAVRAQLLDAAARAQEWEERRNREDNERFE